MEIEIIRTSELLDDFDKMNSLYALWKEVWSTAYVEDFSLDEKLTSDYFSSQDIFIALKEQGKYFSLISLKYFNLSYHWDLDNSYFKVWPKEVIYKLQQLGTHYFSCGNLAVIKSYRGRKIEGEFSIKDIMFAVVREVLISSKCHGVISNTRNLRSVNKAAYRTGAIALEKDVEFSIKGQTVDLLMWHREFLGNYESKNLYNYVQSFLTKGNEYPIPIKNLAGENYVNEIL